MEDSDKRRHERMPIMDPPRRNDLCGQMTAGRREGSRLEVEATGWANESQAGGNSAGAVRCTMEAVYNKIPTKAVFHGRAATFGRGSVEWREAPRARI